MKRVLLLFVVLLLVAGCTCTKEPAGPAQGTVKVGIEAAPEESAPAAPSAGSVGVEIEEAPVEAEAATPEAPAEEVVVAVATNEVMVNRKNFDPETISIIKGDTVTWKNLDDRKHLVVGKNVAFKSKNLMQGETFSYTFEETGTFDYVDAIFGSRGTVIVK